MIRVYFMANDTAMFFETDDPPIYFQKGFWVDETFGPHPFTEAKFWIPPSQLRMIEVVR